MQNSISATAELQLLLSTPPNNPEWKHQTPNNPIAIAHASLQALRDSGDERFLFLRTIIELVNQRQQQQQQQPLQSSSSSSSLSNDNEELLFHCITGCRQVVLYQWNALSPPFKRSVRDFFMILGHDQREAFSRPIRLASYNASASIWKRQWNEMETVATTSTITTNTSHLSSSVQQPVTLPPTQQQQQQQQQLIDSMNQFLSLPSLQTKRDLFGYLDQLVEVSPAIAASFLDVLVGEFSGTSSSNYRMPLEFHKRAHACFEQQPPSYVTVTHGPTSVPPIPVEEQWLNRALHISMKGLSQVVTSLMSMETSNPTTQHNSSQLHQISSSSPTTSPMPQDVMAIPVVQVIISILGWEFGSEAWGGGSMMTTVTTNRTLIRPPIVWKDMVLQQSFVQAMFQLHGRVARRCPVLGHHIRQLLLLLVSMTGPIFQGTHERLVYCTTLLEGILELLQSSTTAQESSELLDTLSMISRLIANFKLSILVQVPQGLFQSLLQGVASIGRHLLHDNLRECEMVRGNLEQMEHREWREEALALLLEGVVLLSGDPWLLYSGTEDSRLVAQSELSTILAPLYAEFVTCRTRMARWEEHYLMTQETDLDEVGEEIVAVNLEDEMASLSNVGRLDLSASLSCLSGLFRQLVPQLQTLWEGSSGATHAMSPDAAGLLEESRLVTMYIGHLLTDDNAGETPVIPDSIIIACQGGGAPTGDIASSIQTLLQFAEAQASKIAAQPSDPRLSPLLAKAFLWFLNRWAPAYILPVDCGASKNPSPILTVWSHQEAVQQAVSFCITLCRHYQSYWPLERHVQEHSALLLLSLAKRCRQMRMAMVASPSFREAVRLHCLTAGIRHSASPAEFESTIVTKAGNQNIPPLEMARGYQRLPYDIKSKVLTALLVACSEHDDETATSMLNDCLQAIHDAFSSLVHVLA